MRYFISCLALSLATLAIAQPKSSSAPERPRLVVGIVVDQMRWDYLYRYSEKYSQGGFKRLMHEGYNCQNTHINYLPSYTGPGHACIYTGSVPAINGIVGNAWYDVEARKEVSCVEDSSAKLVGNGTLKGNVSPKNLLVTTVTDELRLATNNGSKVVSLALKDRSAVLPGGHHPTGAYFADVSSGNFITSSYYASQLPQWVSAFNEKNLVAKYLSESWNTLFPIAEYTESTADDEPFERAYKGEAKPIFPHNLPELRKDNPDLLSYTPFGNSLTLDFARAAVTGENLGKGNFTDFLAISLSSTDLVGHQFGPNSVEVEDCYIRLDKDLGDFFDFLDDKIGRGNYLVFLTADHGAAHSVGLMQQQGIPGGSFDIDQAIKQLNQQGGSNGENLILSHENMQLYLNPDFRNDDDGAIYDYLKQFDAIADVLNLHAINTYLLPAEIKELIANGYNAKRSGDIQIIYKPEWLEGVPKGTTHGSIYNYDRHIPLLWMGWKIKHGEDYGDVHMTDIAPTLSALLHIQEPSGSIGKIIPALLEK